jgi:hypothetical protein
LSQIEAEGENPELLRRAESGQKIAGAEIEPAFGDVAERHWRSDRPGRPQQGEPRPDGHSRSGKACRQKGCNPVARGIGEEHFLDAATRLGHHDHKAKKQEGLDKTTDAERPEHQPRPQNLLERGGGTEGDDGGEP